MSDLVGIDGLAATLARVAGDHAYCRLIAGPPDGDLTEWASVASMHDDPSVLARWVDELVARHPVPAGTRPLRDVGGSLVSGWVADGLVAPLVEAVLTERRAWPLDPDTTWLHRDPAGWCDGVAIDSPRLIVTADDALAAGTDVEVVSGLDALLDRVSAEVVETLAPMFAAIRAVAPFGLRGMWGNVADLTASSAAWWAVRTGSDPEAAQRVASGLTDRLVAVLGSPITRPTSICVTWSGGEATAVARGTCCLIYKAEAITDPDGVENDQYCTSCPKRDAASQHDRLATWLNGLAESGELAPG